MLQLSFFRNLTFLGSNLVGLAMSFGFFGMIFFLGLFMQEVQGYTPTQAGVRQLASTLAVMVAAVVSGRIVSKIGARVPIVVGMVLVGACCLGFVAVQADTPYSTYWPMLTLMGIGIGLVMSPMTSAVMSTVPAARAGMASATLNTTRQVGGVFGIAVLGSVVTGRFISELRISLNGLNVNSAITEKIVEVARQGFGASSGNSQSIPAPIHDAIRFSFTAGMHHALWYAGIVVLAGAVVAAVMIQGTAPHKEMARRAAADAGGAVEHASDAEPAGPSLGLPESE